MQENQLSRKTKNKHNVQHVYIIGAKSIGQYGGFETFVDKLTEHHQNHPLLKSQMFFTRQRISTCKGFKEQKE